MCFLSFFSHDVVGYFSTCEFKIPLVHFVSLCYKTIFNQPFYTCIMSWSGICRLFSLALLIDRVWFYLFLWISLLNLPWNSVLLLYCFSADIGYVYNVPTCIQGQNIGSGWKYNDGSEMVYFNWWSKEPNGNTHLLFMVRQFN